MYETDRIPTIDLLPFISSNEVDPNDDQLDAKKKKIKEVINHAYSEYGFFQIVNHGVPVGLMSRALDLSKTFFYCPDDEKLNRTDPIAGQYERLLMFTPNSRFKNIYPDNTPEFSFVHNYMTMEVLQEIFSHLTKTGSAMEEILKECLNLPPNFLHEYDLDQKWDFMVNLAYQPATATESSGLNEHQDSNCITFVFQDDVGGLEVLKEGKWIPVIPNKGSIIVNIGDIIQISVLNNDKYKSAKHRVVSQMGSRLNLVFLFFVFVLFSYSIDPNSRHSFEFFYNLEGDNWIKPLPQFTTEIGEELKYKGFYYKDYQALRLRNKTHPPSIPEDFIDITHYAIPS
ncbi:hypothetical protein MKX01_038883 [Papaver californicum]|nr:hypothetical protein MKX01_038883 [Papaver californicum]